MISDDEYNFVMSNKNEGLIEFITSAGGLSLFVYGNYDYSFNEIRDIMHKILDDALNKAMRYQRSIENESG